MSAPEIEFSTVTGPAMRMHLDEIAALRIEVFREWPYLYEGTVDYERDYLLHYARCPSGVAVLAHSRGKVVGASTALPLAAAAKEFQEPFGGSKYHVDEVFYFGESVLRETFRGQSVGRKFFIERERVAREQGFCFCAFCAVDRDLRDPRRPQGYRDLANFWDSLGYEKQENLRARLKWQEIDKDEETVNTLTFWLKMI